LRDLSLAKKIAFSLSTTIAILALVEFALSLAGIEPVTKLDDPFVGFSNQLPLVESSVDSQGHAIMSVAKNKTHWFNNQSFPSKKPPNTFRIFCLGGSTTYGHPYWDPTSYSRWLRELLPLVDPSQNYEVINLGGISYASYRVANVMEEMTQYEPDLFIVYSVHNEFLERRTYAAMFDQSPIMLQLESALSKTRIWSMMDRVLRNRAQQDPKVLAKDKKVDVLPAEVDEILNHTIGPVDYHRDADWKSKVLNHYEFNLNRMVQIARQSGAKILFLTPASNEKNCSPFKSELDQNLSDADRQQVQSLLRQAYTEETDDNPDKAIELLQAAILIDVESAELHYRLGKLQFSQRQFSQAMASFRRALNEDVCPIRAVDGITAAIRRVAERQNVSVVDFEAKLRALCLQQHGHSILGDEYFMDHVHPSVEVHQQMARWILQSLQETKMVAGKRLSDPTIFSQVERVAEKIHGEIDSTSYGIALRNLAKVLHWAGKFDEAEPRAREAIALLRDDPESQFVLADCLRNTGRSDEAIVEFDRLFATSNEFERAYHPFGDLLAKQGLYEAAKAYLLLASLREPQDARIFYTLGVVHLNLGEYAFAVESLVESDRLLPNNSYTNYFLAQAYVGNNQPEAAIRLLKKGLDQGFEVASTHFALGMLYFEQSEMQKAIKHLESAVELDPGFEEAIKYLEIARSK